MRGAITAIDTHQIWQEGHAQPTREPLRIVDRRVAMPDRPDLGVEPDMDRTMAAPATTRSPCAT